LEGLVHALRTETTQARAIFQSVRKSDLWDKKLKMYKVNASLENESFELGRTKAFPAGWLENGSIWLHMEYKYLLELLKNGLYDEFYEGFFQALVPFQKPGIYGRSILENSSFIVSSCHKDASLHGRGFVARLSGSTAEFIHIWLLMNLGRDPFFLNDAGELCLRFRPALASRLFTKQPASRPCMNISGERVSVRLPGRSYSFLAFGKTLVTYTNPKKKNTFGKNGVRPLRISLFDKNGLLTHIQGSEVCAPYAERVRCGEIERIEVLLG
jgi:hypothetical protein